MQDYNAAIQAWNAGARSNFTNQTFTCARRACASPPIPLYVAGVYRAATVQCPAVALASRFLHCQLFLADEGPHAAHSSGTLVLREYPAEQYTAGSQLVLNWHSSSTLVWLRWYS